MTLTTRKRKYLLRFFLIALPLLLFFAYSSVTLSQDSVLPTVDSLFSNPELQKPTHILRYKNHYVTTELFENKLAIFEDLDLSTIHHFDPETIGKHFTAPHFLAISPEGHLLISNGWGNSIVKIEDLNGSGWEEFSGLPGSRFKAPHGMCVDEDGWIYVGDSRNSRIVRFKDMQGASWQVFKDVDKVVSYTRQLVCKDGSVWVSNSYETLDGQNSGLGGNVLRIDDFGSGKVQIVFADKDTNVTGIYPLDDYLLVARWSGGQDIVAVDRKSGDIFPIENSHNQLGIPYGMFKDKTRHQVIVAYLGSLTSNPGGLATLNIKPDRNSIVHFLYLLLMRYQNS